MVLEKSLGSPLDCKEVNQSILKEISPGCSLKGLVLKLKLQYFGHLIQRADSLGGKELDMTERLSLSLSVTETVMDKKDGMDDRNFLLWMVRVQRYYKWELHLEGDESREEGKIKCRVWTSVGVDYSIWVDKVQQRVKNTILQAERERWTRDMSLAVVDFLEVTERTRVNEALLISERMREKRVEDGT